MIIIMAMNDLDDKANVVLPHHNQLSILPGPIKASLKYGTLERDGSTVDGLDLWSALHICRYDWLKAELQNVTDMTDISV